MTPAAILLSALFLSSPTHALDDLAIPSSTENTGQNKYERINSIEKEFTNVIQGINEGRKEQREFTTQLTAVKTEIQKLREENQKLSTDNESLRSLIAELKRSLEEQKKVLEQTRISLYGEDGKKEKDALLKEKASPSSR